jgi:Holliday junction resolvase RusA-like endonuclease
MAEVRKFYVISIPGKPQGKGRHRSFVTKSGKIGSYTPQTTRAYEELVAWTWKSKYKGTTLAGPLGMEITIMKKANKKNIGEYCTVRPDGSNVLKIIEDGLNGIAYHDDSQIVKGSFLKVYALDEAVLVYLWEIR